MRAMFAVAVLALVAASGLALGGQRPADTVSVYKDAGCGCCAKWIEHLEQHGFATTTNNVANMDEIKTKHGVPPHVRSCHTGIVAGYVIEGHVPAADVRRLLKERPAGVVGLAVPGMPVGSPGMEVGSRVQPYSVLAFDKERKTTVFARHGEQGPAR
jgi:hypothetical protein